MNRKDQFPIAYSDREKLIIEYDAVAPNSSRCIPTRSVWRGGRKDEAYLLAQLFNAHRALKTAPDASAPTVAITEFDAIHEAGEPAEAGYERDYLKKRLAQNPYAVAYVLSVLAKTAPPHCSHAGNLWAMYEWATAMVNRSLATAPAQKGGES